MVHHSLPSPEYTGDSDSDSDIIHELERKRKQLDEEVARFKAQKDKEFRDFESDLKSRRRQKRVQQYQRNNASNFYEFTKNSPSATPPARSMLSECEKKARSPQRHHGHKQSEPMRLMKPNLGSKVTPPTICLDKMNIRGENLQKSHVSPLQTPPTPTALSTFASTTETVTTQSHASPTTFEKQTSSSASINSETPRNEPPFSPEETKHDQALAGLFAPAYLPLLDAANIRHQMERPIEGTQTEPASPAGHSMSIESLTFQASSLPTESSLAESFQVPVTKRAHTSPSTATHGTLAPITRDVNGRKGNNEKRKHITF